MDRRSNDIQLATATAGTCEWLLEHTVYKNWAACDRSLLCIIGKPGSGKSTLLQYALSRCIEDWGIRDRIPIQRSNDSTTSGVTAGVKPSQRVLTLSFFFHGRGAELQKTPLGIFRSLLHQLLRLVPEYCLALLEVFQKKQSDGKHWEWHLLEVQRLFDSVLQVVLTHRPVMLFVDALDESGKSNANEVIQRFVALLDKCSPEAKLRVCLTCRHHPILRIQHPGTFIICPENENRDDISTYVQAKLSGDTSWGTWGWIQETITTQASGVFMWARLVVERVLVLKHEGASWKKIKAVIEQIPPQLDELYDGLIRGMEDKSTSLKLVQWLCFSIRPLSLDELKWAMVTDHESSNTSLLQYDLAGDIPSNMANYLKTLSCGLAEVVESNDVFSPPNVQFIHQSVNDFFLQKGLSYLHGIQDRESLTENNETLLEGIAHYRLSRICMRYMSMELEEMAQSRDLISANPDPITFSSSSFLNYSVTLWLHHVLISQKRGVSQGDILAYFDWPSEMLMQRWTQACELPTVAVDELDRPPKGTTMLHIASKHHLKDPLGLILETADHDVINAQDAEGQTPLYTAAIEGHAAVVSKLIGEGANVNAQGGLFGNALQAASSRGHKGVIQVLLGRGADINAQGGHFGTALQAASVEGSETIVQVLLEGGADVNAQGGHYGNALQAASHGWSETIVRSLLDSGADVNAQGGWYGSALQAASEGRSEAIVRLLLDRGADTNARGGRWGGDALQVASYDGNEAVVRLLLERGADLGIIDGEFSALHMASSQGLAEVVRILLEKVSKGERQVNINAVDECGRTALILASQEGHLDIVQELLAEGADLNVEGYDGDTALSLALEQCDSRVVKFLLDQEGINVKAGSWYASLERGPLIRAIQGGDKATLHEVLARTSNSEINERDRFGMTPLSVAVARGDRRVAALLLQDPRINLQNDHNRDCFGRSLLWWVKSCGDHKLEKLLVRHVSRQRLEAPNDTIPVLDTRGARHLYFTKTCDICTRDLDENEGCYCNTCISGYYFRICSDCFLLGGRCLNDSHTLRESWRNFESDTESYVSDASCGSIVES